MDRWVCPLLIGSMTQALYVAVWRVAPFPPLLLIHTPEAPIQPGPGWGEVGALLSWGILRGGCQGCNCVDLYFPREEEGGETIEREGKRETRRGGVPKESLDTDGLVNRHPQRGRG